MYWCISGVCEGVLAQGVEFVLLNKLSGAAHLSLERSQGAVSDLFDIARMVILRCSSLKPLL
jgi:hypothetical protein